MAHKDEIFKLEDVMSVVESAGQYQVVLRDKVENIYGELEPLVNRKIK